jgi:hypothetical protein
MLHRAFAILLAVNAASAATAVDDAAAIFTRQCLPCHDARGSAPLRLDSVERIARNRTLARMLIEDATMPPSIALPDANGLLVDRRLSIEDRATLLNALSSSAFVNRAFAGITSGAQSDSTEPTFAPPHGWTLPAAGGARVRTFMAATTNPNPNTATATATRVRGVRFADLGAREQRPIQMAFLAADPRGTLRMLEEADDGADDGADTDAENGGFEAMGNVGLVPSGALGAVSRVRPSFELPDGYCFEIPVGFIAIETLCEPIGRRTRVLPQLAWIPAREGDTRVVKAIAMPAKALTLSANSCSTIEIVHPVAVDMDVVAVLVKGGAFLRSVDVEVEVELKVSDAGKTGAALRTRLLGVPDYRMAFAEPWIFTRPQRVAAGATIVARLGFDNTADNPQQPSRPPQDVESGLPPLSEDAMVVVLYAPAAISK